MKRKNPQRRRDSKQPRSVTFGYYPKEGAVRAAHSLQTAGIPCRIAINRDFARRHHAATAFHPGLRRARSHRDITMGYTLRVPIEHADAARTAITAAGLDVETPELGHTSTTPAPDFDADPRWCPRCVREVPPKTLACPDCGKPTVDILQRTNPPGRSLPLWVVALLFGILLVIAAVRLL